MKFTIDAQTLYKACQAARQVAPGRTTFPILNFMQLKAQGGKITVRSTNLEAMVWATIPGEADSEGEICLPIKLIDTFTKKEKGKVIIESLEGNKASITGSEQGGSATLTMDTVVPKDMVPDEKISIETKPVSFEVGGTLSRALGMALTCAATEGSRPVLTGVLLDGSDGNLSLATADGFRLFSMNLNIPMEESQAIIPGPTAFLISQLMAGKDISVNIYGSKASFETDDYYIVTQLVQGSFPQYLQLIPTAEPTWTFECSAPLLEKRLNQYLAYKEGSGIVRMMSNSDDDPALKLEMGSGDYEAHYKSIVPATLTGDKEGKIAASQQYLSEAIRFFSSVKFSMTSPSSPMIITGDLEGLIIVLMPMFVQW